MLEYICEAVVLHREPNGDLDNRFSLFTKKFGKLVAKGKSTRKITSKLSSHLQPGNVVSVRLIEKNGLQVVDALKKYRLTAILSHLHFLDRILGEAEPDQHIWQFLLEGLRWREILRVLGWDPQEALCSLCDNSKPTVFNVRNQEFFCRGCASKLNQNDVLYIDTFDGAKLPPLGRSKSAAQCQSLREPEGFD